ncbi:hypothetical protein GYMLUDRAFT_238984 [Collybiopsis luxurians FD-317 M1]|nr:hypothetical protein GYMLUDRAFT_238984 [Collybiopsis luxurians FD-317 M1]
MHGKQIRELSNKVKNVLEMVLYEHGRAHEKQKKDMLSQLEDRLDEFSKTVEDCEQLADMLHGRNMFTVGLMRVSDLRRIRELQAEVKKRRADLESGFTRLKICPPEDVEQCMREENEIPEDYQEQRPSNRSSNIPSSVAPRSSPTNITPAPNPATTLTRATVGGGCISTVANDMYQYHNTLKAGASIARKSENSSLFWGS